MFKKVAFPNPVKNDIKSHPVHTNKACITDPMEKGGIVARSGSLLKAVFKACMLRRCSSADENGLNCTITFRCVLVIIGKPM